ncbi:Regulatory protein SoxS [Klebsiella pneumoniae]|nr:Regulatory protein SoxS [Klebsiella pneumoniae]
MSHQDIIQTLIEWIDEHIDQPLNIDIVARKSGYSKWYLQRMFRTVMHQTLGGLYSPAPPAAGGGSVANHPAADL